MKTLTCCLASGIVAIVAGCDRPAQPPAPAATRPGASLNAPSTKSSAATSRKTLQLSPYPIRVSVPADWSIVEFGNVMFLQGPTPGGREAEDVVRVQISSPPPIAQAAADRLEKDFGPGKNAADASVLKTDARPCGRGRLLEKRAIEKLSDGSAILVNWTLDVLVPGDQDRSSLYHLSFVALSQARYEKDREFLETIVASLDYAPALEVRPK